MFASLDALLRFDGATIPLAQASFRWLQQQVSFFEGIFKVDDKEVGCPSILRVAPTHANDGVG